MALENELAVAFLVLESKSRVHSSTCARVAVGPVRCVGVPLRLPVVRQRAETADHPATRVGKAGRRGTRRRGSPDGDASRSPRPRALA